MAGSSSEESGVGRSFDGISSGQHRSQSGEALAEWRSSDQVENGIPSTSPPYWDTDDDDDCDVNKCWLYADMGRWSEVEEVRRLMKERGLKKDSGNSSLELESQELVY